MKSKCSAHILFFHVLYFQIGLFLLIYHQIHWHFYSYLLSSTNNELLKRNLIYQFQNFKLVLFNNFYVLRFPICPFIINEFAFLCLSIVVIAALIYFCLLISTFKSSAGQSLRILSMHHISSFLVYLALWTGYWTF